MNYPAYFEQSENGNQYVLSDYTGSCASFVCGFGSVTSLFSSTPILDV
jgi:hypothetical protein